MSIGQENHRWASATTVPKLTDAMQSGHNRELHSLHTHALHEVRAFRSLFQSHKLLPCFISCCTYTHDVWHVSFLVCEYGSLCTHDAQQRWGDAWCNALHVCFPSLPPVLWCLFESRLGLESSGINIWHFLKLVARVFS